MTEYVGERERDRERGLLERFFYKERQRERDRERRRKREGLLESLYMGRRERECV